VHAEKVAGLAGGEPAETARREHFERVWQEHRPRVWRLVARLAGDLDLADDLTQEVSLRAFQAFGEFRGEASAFTWLYRIAVNVVNRHHERRRGAAVPLDLPEIVQLPTDSVGGPEAMALRADLRAAVWAAVEGLPSALRTTLILQVYEGLRYHEIASILNVPIGTVKSRLHHAMQRLREECKQYEV
jgi:RNA polymerase sigma-70 factor (ECF subfamily)